MPVVNGVFVVDSGMPASVFRDKYARKKSDGTFQSWKERIQEVVDGNCALAPVEMEEYDALLQLALKGVIPFSGRHLQHGDLDQPLKRAELFMNCTSAMFSWASFLLLMKGCGVGRDFSSDICFVDWDFVPNSRFVLEAPDNQGKGGHPDYQNWIESLADARHKYDAESESVRWFEVEDSAEGWAKVVMIIETAAFHKHNKDTVFVFDFSKVRPFGAPLRGQQNRPASGPVPFIKALQQVMSIKGAGMKPWKQALFIDHYLAACVVVGGVRRSARIAVKSCYDRDVIDFIDIKRGGYLWSANNTIVTNDAFWEKARNPRPSHERRVFEAAGGSSYWDDTGEPGWLNVDRLNDYREGLDGITVGTYLSPDFQKSMGGIHPRTWDMIEYHLEKAKKRSYIYIPNPCGEIPLAVWGAYCDIGDLCLANASDEDEVYKAASCLAKALVRVNVMNSMYRAEVLRTNRIGVSLTGIHEFMWRQYRLSFRDSLDADYADVFWDFIANVRNAVEAAAREESDRLNLPHPATYTCIKPSGTVSKVMNCTEGAHLPATRYYLRWVAMPNDANIEKYTSRGYLLKDISHQYPNTVVIGFPTCLPIVREMPEEELVTASEATPEEQYKWLGLLEKYWLGPDRRNAQISYTLKWKKQDLSYEEYMKMILEHQPNVRCCSLIPELEQDESAYAYLPEEPISKERYDDLMAGISRFELESYNAAQLECEGGVCPIEEDIHAESIGVRSAAN